MPHNIPFNCFVLVKAMIKQVISIILTNLYIQCAIHLLCIFKRSPQLCFTLMASYGKLQPLKIWEQERWPFLCTDCLTSFQNNTFTKSCIKIKFPSCGMGVCVPKVDNLSIEELLHCTESGDLYLFSILHMPASHIHFPVYGGIIFHAFCIYIFHTPEYISRPPDACFSHIPPHIRSDHWLSALIINYWVNSHHKIKNEKASLMNTLNCLQIQNTVYCFGHYEKHFCSAGTFTKKRILHLNLTKNKMATDLLPLHY